MLEEEGGGEFFFYSYDNEFILKSLSEEDLSVILNNVWGFYEHFKKNPYSIINKIYSIYRIKRSTSEYSSDIVLMLIKNIARVPNCYINVGFDLKGSTFNRESKINSKLSYKDLDFIKKEKKIFIGKETAKTLYDIIKRDVNFLKNLKIMDYSLLVYKIDHYNFLKDLNSEEEKKEKIILFAKEKFKIIPSIKEEGIFYHIAIIDYMQIYSFRKSLEKVSKKFFNLNINLDTSSQDPNKYAERFLLFMKDILF